MYPMFNVRSSSLFKLFLLLKRLLLILIFPLVALSSPPIRFSVVVFPEPDGPSSETNPLSGSFNEVFLIT